MVKEEVSQEQILKEYFLKNPKKSIKTSSKKTNICPYKNVNKCPILKRWRGENLDNNTNI